MGQRVLHRGAGLHSLALGLEDLTFHGKGRPLLRTCYFLRGPEPTSEVADPMHHRAEQGPFEHLRSVWNHHCEIVKLKKTKPTHYLLDVDEKHLFLDGSCPRSMRRWDC